MDPPRRPSPRPGRSRRLLALVAAPPCRRWTARCALPGLSAPVTVRRDGLGVPHIQAASLPDLMRAQGYVTAQDRMWQMDLLRRRAEGQLAEAFGTAALRGRPRRAHARAWARPPAERLPHVPSDLRVLARRLRGRRQRLAVHARRFASPRVPPAALRAAALGGRGQPRRRQAPRPRPRAGMGGRGPARPRLRSPARRTCRRCCSPSSSPRTASWSASDVAVPAGGGEALTETARGSNNWVISGAHTASGRPLLANDPHLGARACRRSGPPST